MKYTFDKFKTNRQSSGFTLLELMVIIVMVGILAAIVAPSWLSFLNRQRLSTVESDLVQTIKRTQQDAIQRRQSVKFEVKKAEDLPTVNNGIDISLGSGSGIRPGMINLDSYSVGLDGDDNTVKNQDTELYFDYQGKPIELDSSGNPVAQELPFVITISSDSFTAKQCVIVANLIGSLKTAEGDNCDDPPVDPVDPT